MKYFRADLHVHSRFSRATSGRLNIRNLAAWSMIKGLSVMSTGDFTHPAWRDELRRDLVYDDNSGLYRVREKTPLETEIPGFSRPDGISEPQFLSLRPRGEQERTLFDQPESAPMRYEIEAFQRMALDPASAESYSRATLETAMVMDEARRQMGIVFPADAQ